MKENRSPHKLHQLCGNKPCQDMLRKDMPRKTNVLKILYSLPKLLLCALIRLYQILISPLLPQHCRFYPRCSEYSLEALKEYGALRGLALAFCRILRCHPWNLGGYDPVVKSPESKHLCRKEQSK